MAELAYKLFQFLVSILIGVFYSEIEVRGLENLPDKKEPIIFAGTHPNALVDPALIMVYCPRTITPVAKDQLFKLPVLGSIMRAIGAVPVKRAQDHSGEKQDNTAMFEAMWSTLAKGNTVAIFPEGTTVFEPHMRPLKTGAARIAVGFSARYKRPISIVPVGLNYMERNRFRSKVLVLFGRPITVDSRTSEPDLQFEEAKKLTTELQETLQSLTINAPDWGTLRMIETARNLYIPDDAEVSSADHVELMRRFINGYKHASQKDNSKVEGLRRDIENYQFKLDALGLTDSDVTPHRKQRFSTDKASTILYLLLWPLAMLGGIMNSPIAIMSKLGGTLAARGEIVEVATYTLLVALVSCVLFYTAIPFALALYFNVNVGIIALITLMLTGYAAVTVRPFQSSVNFIRSATKVAPKDLKEERAQLRQRLLQAVEEFADPNMQRMFYGGKKN